MQQLTSGQGNNAFQCRKFMVFIETIVFSLETRLCSSQHHFKQNIYNSHCRFIDKQLFTTHHHDQNIDFDILKYTCLQFVESSDFLLQSELMISFSIEVYINIFLLDCGLLDCRGL